MAGLPNLYSVIDGKCTLKVENNCYTENTFYMKQAVADTYLLSNLHIKENRKYPDSVYKKDGWGIYNSTDC